MLDVLDSVAAEMLAARGLAPLRLLVRGPPASGKSHLAVRLAHLYGLPLISVSTILAEAPRCDPELQKVLTAELAGKEGRVSPRTMARLLQHLVSRDPRVARRGYVLDGWPKTLAQARVAFDPSVAAAAALPAGGAQQQRRQSLVGEGAGGGCAAAGTKDKKKGGGSGSAVGAAGGAAGGAAAKEGAARRLLTAGAQQQPAEQPAADAAGLSSADLFPHWLVQLDAPQGELLRRVKALAAGEEAAAHAAAAAAAAAAATTQQPPSAGGGGRSSVAAASAQQQQQRRKSVGVKDGGVDGGAEGEGDRSHNNERDFTRRYDAWRLVVAEDAADLAARVSGCVVG